MGGITVVLGVCARLVIHPTLMCAGCRPHLLLGRLLYDLFTSPAFVDQLPPLLVACNKADADGAQSCEHVKKLLESALYVGVFAWGPGGGGGELTRFFLSVIGVNSELLKVTRASLGSTGDGDDALRLGRPGAPFEFDVDAPCEVRRVANVASGRFPGLVVCAE